MILPSTIASVLVTFLSRLVDRLLLLPDFNRGAASDRMLIPARADRRQRRVGIRSRGCGSGGGDGTVSRA